MTRLLPFFMSMAANAELFVELSLLLFDCDSFFLDACSWDFFLVIIGWLSVLGWLWLILWISFRFTCCFCSWDSRILILIWRFWLESRTQLSR